MASRLLTKISRRDMLRAALASGAGAAALAVVGCGSNGEDVSGTSTSTPSGGQATSTPPSAPSSIAGPQARAASWSPVTASGAAPAARRDHSLTFAADTGLIYLFGGRARGEPMDDLWSFDPKTAAWQQIIASGEAPAARFGHVAAYERSTRRLLVATGQAGSSFFNDLLAFDPATGSWRESTPGTGDMPATRYGAGGALDADGLRLLLSHGFTDSGRFDDTWSFSVGDSTWTKLETRGETPVKRCLLRTLWVPERREMLLFGGQTNDNPFLGDFWSLGEDGAWSEKKPEVLPGPRNLYGASLSEGGQRWYITGGNTPAGPSGETWAYDLAADAWSQVDTSASAAVPAARYGADAAVAGGKLYMFGGHDGSAELSDLWALDLGV